ncbi:hypothetical protein [Aeribacillus sp. FSL M8-0254]|uniref:hypothetical protein n=1 Tax=Aeribacillus sp. FSL M8-0254 TaxID=2954577 RepID=UPI0030FCB379
MSRIHWTNVHILPDENLGGVLREYVEVDRKAEVGEYIFTINTNEIHKVTKGSEDGVYIDGWVYVYDGYYRTLEPTSIVHIDGQRYRLVDRKAKVGEKVIVVVANDTLVYRNVGEIVEIIETDGSSFGGMISPHDLGEKGAIYHFQYLVLEPVEPAEESDDETEASESVLDLLANLARRVAELERKLGEYARKIDGIEVDIQNINVDLGTVEENIEMIIDDIVTLDERTQPLVALVKAVKGDE